ncbi:DUF4386 domain-containing protein [Panacibacter ginsenosidivorans]|uniref:DUF4386 domain-containing protein n=1 Tax=Panacibacter ginsenosidivorans TaxID=1813871 RepID=A0A5B8VAN6_9BACT|nr:DUF4386 domain-containing protein [Panacibacter ginsenosidivorans]QEC68329.1 DUF4386 domain-containing protein [Panacibacter ginsenosidivorans]
MSTSVNKTARIGGILYLIIIAAGFYGEMFVRSKLIVSGNAAATANNIITSQLLWRSGIATDLLMHICDIPLMLIFYLLLKPVDKNLALMSLLFNLIQTAVLVVNKLSLIVALFPLSSRDYLKSFDAQQLYTLAYLSIKAHGYGFGLGLMFFGCTCLIMGYLIFKSGYLPKTIGVLMQIAGVCYLANIFAPESSDKIFPAILLPPFIAELSLCLWLIFKGVNIAVWEKQLT